MGALTFAVLVVLGFDEVDTGASPLLGERICVVHVHIDGSAADPLRIGAWSGEMDRQLAAMGERVPLVVVRGAEAQLLVMSNRTRYIRDHEDRLDTDDALHSEIIGGSPTCICVHLRFSVTFPHTGQPRRLTHFWSRRQSSRTKPSSFPSGSLMVSFSHQASTSRTLKL